MVVVVDDLQDSHSDMPHVSWLCCSVATTRARHPNFPQYTTKNKHDTLTYVAHCSSDLLDQEVVQEVIAFPCGILVGILFHEQRVSALPSVSALSVSLCCRSFSGVFKRSHSKLLEE
eukprot:scaffold3380_cov106-Cylindrotheca_fusiformis.AAC.7